MEMNVRKAQFLPGGLMLYTDADIGNFVYNFKPGDYVLQKKRQKRSLDANAYAWVLIGKISDRVHIERDRVYQGAIRQIDGVSEIINIKNEAVDQFREAWSHNGVGYQTDILNRKSDGTTDLMVYFGSSTYNTKQMSKLINQLVMTAQDLGIETEDPNNIKSLLDQWGDR